MKNTNRIDSFRNEYYFLSNMFPCDVQIGKYHFDCAEAAFQAYKCRDVKRIKDFEHISGFEAKKLGRRLLPKERREDWAQIRIRVMIAVLQAKFAQNPILMERLLETGNAELIEGNTWKDSFWGVYQGEGENWLGKLLMGIREEASGAAGGFLAQATCLEKSVHFLSTCCAQQLHALVRKTKRLETFGKPAINAGSRAKEYAGMNLCFATKSGFDINIAVSTHGAYAHIGDLGVEHIKLRLEWNAVSALNEIGELFYSYQDDSEEERIYNPAFDFASEDDDYWDKDAGEYVNRFSMDEQYNWDARYGQYVERVRRTSRDDEPMYVKSCVTSQMYEELKALKKIRLAEAEKSKYKLKAPADGKLVTARELYDAGRIARHA